MKFQQERERGVRPERTDQGGVSWRGTDWLLGDAVVFTAGFVAQYLVRRTANRHGLTGNSTANCFICFALSRWPAFGSAPPALV